MLEKDLQMFSKLLIRKLWVNQKEDYPNGLLVMVKEEVRGIRSSRTQPVFGGSSMKRPLQKKRSGWLLAAESSSELTFSKKMGISVIERQRPEFWKKISVNLWAFHLLSLQKEPRPDVTLINTLSRELSTVLLGSWPAELVGVCYFISPSLSYYVTQIWKTDIITYS